MSYVIYTLYYAQKNVRWVFLFSRMRPLHNKTVYFTTYPIVY